MKHLIVLALLAFLLPACGSPPTPPPVLPLLTYTPLPTYTPYPTQTPYPTYTAIPVAQTSPLPPTSIPLSTAPIASVPVSSKCIAWNAAPSHLGETTCVRGDVAGTYKDAKSNAFFIDFDNSHKSFYAVSFKYSWDNLKGQCVEISGKITPYNGRPQIIVESKSQVELCK